MRFSTRGAAYAYYFAACCVCDKTAHYRVGNRAFCRKHQALADALKRADISRRDVEAAQKENTKQEADQRRRRLEKLRAIDPKRNYKPKA